VGRHPRDAKPAMRMRAFGVSLRSTVAGVSNGGSSRPKL